VNHLRASEAPRDSAVRPTPDRGSGSQISFGRIFVGSDSDTSTDRSSICPTLHLQRPLVGHRNTAGEVAHLSQSRPMITSDGLRRGSTNRSSEVDSWAKPWDRTPRAQRSKGVDFARLRVKIGSRLTENRPFCGAPKSLRIALTELNRAFPSNLDSNSDRNGQLDWTPSMFHVKPVTVMHGRRRNPLLRGCMTSESKSVQSSDPDP
jgi:hypothetical protein